MLEDLILATYSAWITWKPKLNEKNKKSPYCTVHVSAYDLSTENLKKLFPNFTCFLTLTIIIKETIPQSSSPPFLSYFKILLSIFHSQKVSSDALLASSMSTSSIFKGSSMKAETLSHFLLYPWYLVQDLT